jgi:type I restriction enzyme S subunit
MKVGWQTKTLDEVCEIRPPKSEARERVAADALVSFAPMEDLGVERKFLNATQVKRLASVVGSYTYFADGDVLLAKITPCFENGKLGIAANLRNGIGFGSSEFFVLRPRPALNKEYLYYYLSRPDFRSEGAARMGGAVGQQRVPKEFLESYRIPVPPLAEQRRIVGILDEAFDGIATAKANTEKKLQNARALFESHLQSVFTKRGERWVRQRLGDLSRINYGYTESASSEKVGPHFLRITDIQDNRVDWTTVPFCPIDPSDFPKYKLADGDIVFARTGATTGKSYFVTSPPESVFASYLIRVQLSNKELLPQFVNLFFQTQSYWDNIRAGVSGSAQGGFNATKLGELLIPFPKSLEEQHAIVAQFDLLAEETQRLESIYKRKLAALEALKKSLLHRAFTGELTAQPEEFVREAVVA